MYFQPAPDLSGFVRVGYHQQNDRIGGYDYGKNRQRSPDIQAGITKRLDESSSLMTSAYAQHVNFDKYKLLRLPEMPVVESVIANSETDWWGGFGETAGPPMPPALANAIFFATGKRIRSTPILKHDLRWA